MLVAGPRHDKLVVVGWSPLLTVANWGQRLTSRTAGAERTRAWRPVMVDARLPAGRWRTKASERTADVVRLATSARGCGRPSDSGSYRDPVHAEMSAARLDNVPAMGVQSVARLVSLGLTERWNRRAETNWKSLGSLWPLKRSSAGVTVPQSHAPGRPQRVCWWSEEWSHAANRGGGREAARFTWHRANNYQIAYEIPGPVHRI